MSNYYKYNYYNFIFYFRNGDNADTLQLVLNEIRGLRTDMKIGENVMVPKPDYLPCRSVEAVKNLQNINQDQCIHVIQFLRHISSSSDVKTACSLCFQAMVEDIVIDSFTWFGRRSGDNIVKLALCKSKFVMLIATAVSIPTRPVTNDIFQIEIRKQIDLAKQRNRNRNPRRTIGERRLNLEGHRVFGDEP